MTNKDDIGHGAYGEGVLDEPSTYRPEKGDDADGLSSTYAAGTDTEQLVDGGPGPADGGIMTTTGAMDSSTSASTSDATTSAID